MGKKPDFTGYATKSGIKCSDGRVILRDAFKHQDGKTVPLVWQHMHDSPDNILGNVVLENRDDGVFCRGYFNGSAKAQNAKEAVMHGDITSLSIYANQLKEEAKQVRHGIVREVSLVLAGANPGAKIDNLAFEHGEGQWEDDETEAVIYFDQELSHGDTPIEHSEKNGGNTPAAKIFDTLSPEQKDLVYTMLAHAGSGSDNSGSDDMTVKEVFDTLNEQQKKVVYFLIGAAADGAGGATEHSDINEEGDEIMKENVFDQSTKNNPNAKYLSHDQLREIVEDAKKFGSLKESFLAHTEEYGFNPVDILFPDAKDVDPGAPILIKRNTTWVGKVLSKTKHTPFSRIRSRFADITADDARAKGYVTGNLKKEEIIPLMRRVTTPTTIYKKQKLDRDDMIDITDFDVVLFLKGEMRGQLDEEIARAVLISDGRSAADEDKINELNIRPIAMDDGNVFVHRVQVANNMDADHVIDEFIKIRKFYKGSGNPDLYTSTDLLTDMLLLKDSFGHRIYKTRDELAAVLQVGEIIEVEPMNTAVRTVGEVSYPILGIVVNLSDYTIGADKGGQVAMFDDFDIDYNQYKYLIETRISGALTMPKSALIIERLPA